MRRGNGKNSVDIYLCLFCGFYIVFMGKAYAPDAAYAKENNLSTEDLGEFKKYIDVVKKKIYEDDLELIEKYSDLFINRL